MREPVFSLGSGMRIPSLIGFAVLLAACNGSENNPTPAADTIAAEPADTFSVSKLPPPPPPPPVEAQPVLTSIKLTTPLPNDTLRSPATIKGAAGGGWYFEGQFVLHLYDRADNLLASSPAKAQGEWMKEGDVPFEGTLRWNGYSGPALLVLEGDNPSGDREREKKVSVPVWLER
ncbi:MAG: hypothetical protein EOO08_05465 [Chitinophagaceae bacterium]|nr:MAG: hypothetical protein EOO08_05465 [Chitinophagaceae bacterium]